LGADHIALDTLVSFAGFGVDEPRIIDFPAFDEAAAAAGYSLRELTLMVPGHVVSDRCETCADDVWWLALDGVDQRIELRAEPSVEAPGRYTLEVHGWGGVHPRAEVTGWEPAPR
jgi:hypothetical protein